MQILIAVDQLFNALCRGYADETLSARAYRNRNRRPWGPLVYRGINLLFFWQADHCHASFVSEMERRQLPKAYRVSA